MPSGIRRVLGSPRSERPSSAVYEGTECREPRGRLRLPDRHEDVEPFLMTLPEPLTHHESCQNKTRGSSPPRLQFRIRGGSRTSGVAETDRETFRLVSPQHHPTPRRSSREPLL